MGSLSLLQGIFPTQKLSQGLLHCRRILYQLSYQFSSVAQSCPTLCGLYPTRLLCPWDFPGKNTGAGCHALLQGIFPTQGSKPRSPALQADSLPSEPPEKPKNTGVGSLSLLQGIFPTQELSQGLLHCRRIPYQLSYQRSPIPTILFCSFLL